MVTRTLEMKRKTNDFYNNFASQYWKRHANPPKRSIEKFIKLLPGPMVLDLGCGGGRDSIFLQSRGFRPVCVDLSWAMCKAAQEKGFPTVVMDQEEWALGGTFDGAWSRVSLLHSPPELIPRIFSDIRNSLCLNGGLFLGMKTSNSLEIETEFKVTENGSTYYCYWPLSVLSGVLAQSHFKIVEVESQGKDFFGEREYVDILAVAS